jgi:hypothetical protein
MPSRGLPFVRLLRKSSVPNERRLLDNVTTRVRLWKEVAPFYTDADRGAYKTVESRGTESVLNALILASAQTDSSPPTHARLSITWAEQQNNRG